MAQKTTSSKSNLMQQKDKTLLLRFPPIYVIVGAYRFLTDPKINRPIWYAVSLGSLQDLFGELGELMRMRSFCMHAPLSTPRTRTRSAFQRAAVLALLWVSFSGGETFITERLTVKHRVV